MIRTRNAPSPTGYAHIGTIYQSLLDKAYALKNNGKFIIRIEDTDQNRFVADAEDALKQAFDWTGLIADESPWVGGEYAPYRQSERLEIYRKYVNELLEKGHAYYCFCSKERLDLVRDAMQKEGKAGMYDKHCRNLSIEEVESKLQNKESYVVRMKVPENEKIVVEDLIRGKIEFDSNLVDDQVILKSDGFPTYHLAATIDDHLMKITHVVRGPEWITSFPKHKLLYDYFGWDAPVFVHTPLISNLDGSKLAKRQGHSSVDWFRKKGFLPEALLNFISLLGWSHPKEKEIFTFKEFAEVFDLKDLSAVSPKFDLQKLEWMNGQYIQSLSNEEFLKRLDDWLEYCLNGKYRAASEFETTWSKDDYKNLKKFISNVDPLFAEINKQRAKMFEDLLSLNQFFIDDIELDKELLIGQKDPQEIKDHLEWLLETISDECGNDWSLENLKSVERLVAERAKYLNWKVAEVFFSIRIAVCRSKVSPPLFESIYILGRDKTLKRLKESIKIL